MPLRGPLDLPQQMCDRCRKILIGYSRKHQPEECPLLDVAYCTICAKNGHYTSECPCTDILENRQPQYIEQLIPPHVRAQYGIQTLTPIQTTRTQAAEDTFSSQWYPPQHEPTLEVRYDDEEIRLTLARHKVQYHEKGKMDVNRILLENLAKRLNRRLIWTKNSTDFVEKKNEKSQKSTSSSKKNTQGKKLKIAPQAAPQVE